MTDKKDLDKVSQADNGSNEQDSSEIESNLGSSNENIEGQGRRKAIRSILAGGGAITAATSSDKWRKPILNSLVLPAHAQTSPDSMDDPTTTQAPVNSAVGNFTSGGGIVLNGSFLHDDAGFAADEAISEELLEFFIPAASAQSGSFACGPNCSVNVDATFTETTGDLCFSGDNELFVGADVITPVSGAPTMDSVRMGYYPGFNIEGGMFDETSGNWDLFIVDGTNASIVVELAPGGAGCFPT
jgi:hypothetical protein